MKKLLIIGLMLASVPGWSQDWKGKFEQLGEMLPTPNSYRSSSGAPGVNYWQQRADYVIHAEVNDDTQVLSASETITYFNNAPEPLTFLWLQLDQNLYAKGSIGSVTRTGGLRDSIPAKMLATTAGAFDYVGGYKIISVKEASSKKDLHYVINNTMMRIDLLQPLKPGEKYAFSVDWSFNINDRMMVGGRGGMEYFPEDKNYSYTLAQWFPRMCPFDDYEGWQNKQFLGSGEFALTFGNYRVRITVPADHVIGATGWLQNPKEVLTKDQQERFTKAQTSFDQQVFIVTEDEAKAKEKVHETKKSTWEFYAENVRDFAFATSRKFIWDAQAVKVGDKTPLAQSMYPKEGNPLWAKESTRAIKNTLEVYSARTIDYPYPTAFSVHTANQGMEYPMICFNGGRPDKNGKYDRVLDGMISVVVHEVGHNFFPMIVNSDERQWTWMDEGMNTFLEKETKRERYPELDLIHGTPQGIVPFMKGDKNIMRPIMASADNQAGSHGPNGYTKPSAALTLLRETVMGPELFDKAFKEYAQRWAFKSPNPGDFFRTMEDASAVDLDWFWRGWFYTTDNVDLTVDDVKWFKVKKQTADPESKNVKVKSGDLARDSKGKADDFSNGPQEFTLMNTPGDFYGEFENKIDDNAVRKKLEQKNLYEITLKNTGGLVSPVIIEWTFKDGSKEIERIPAEVWRTNEKLVKKIFVKEKEVVNIAIDPNLETADVNVTDNFFPKKKTDSKFDQLKKGK